MERPVPEPAWDRTESNGTVFQPRQQPRIGAQSSVRCPGRRWKERRERFGLSGRVGTRGEARSRSDSGLVDRAARPVEDGAGASGSCWQEDGGGDPPRPGKETRRTLAPFPPAPGNGDVEMLLTRDLSRRPRTFCAAPSGVQGGLPHAPPLRRESDAPFDVQLQRAVAASEGRWKRLPSPKRIELGSGKRASPRLAPAVAQMLGQPGRQAGRSAPLSRKAERCGAPRILAWPPKGLAP